MMNRQQTRFAECHVGRIPPSQHDAVAFANVGLASFVGSLSPAQPSEPDPNLDPEFSGRLFAGVREGENGKNINNRAR